MGQLILPYGFPVIETNHGLLSRNVQGWRHAPRRNYLALHYHHHSTMPFQVLLDDYLTEQFRVGWYSERCLPKWLSLHSRMFVSRVLADVPFLPFILPLRVRCRLD